jgi:DNA-binding PadR family transcriptional regulator
MPPNGEPMSELERDPAGALPLTAAAFQILLALAPALERHGYSITKEVEATTQGAVKLGPGTLYRQLKQMVIDGWIVETEVDEDEETRRRYYRLTPWGLRIARAEAARLDAVVRTARLRELLPVLP